MRNIIAFSLFVFLVVSCQERKVNPYYKVVLSHNEEDFTKSKYFHVLLDRIKICTDNPEYLLKINAFEIELYFEKDFDTNDISNVILKNVNLEFWHTFKNTEFGNRIYEQVNTVLSDSIYPGLISKIEDLDSNTQFSEKIQFDIFTKTSPLSAILYPFANQDNTWVEGAVLGYAKLTDTALINEYFRANNVKNNIPKNLKLMWEFKSTIQSEEGISLLNLYLGKNTKSGIPLLSSSDIVYAKQGFNYENNEPYLSLSFTKAAALFWADITEQSMVNGTAIAICLNEKVISAPIAAARIEGGKTQITGGLFGNQDDADEIKTLASLLNVGNLPKSFELKSIDIIYQNGK